MIKFSFFFKHFENYIYKTPWKLGVRRPLKNYATEKIENLPFNIPTTVSFPLNRSLPKNAYSTPTQKRVGIYI